MLAPSPPVGLIEELRYRCWARRNYLPLEFREPDWHPLILEEMACRDSELAEELRTEELLTHATGWDFVPLAPTMMHYVHPAHSDVREPHYLSAGDSQFTDSIYAGGLYEFPY
jgi:hypothetical protein